MNSLNVKYCMDRRINSALDLPQSWEGGQEYLLRRQDIFYSLGLLLKLIRECIPTVMWTVRNGNISKEKFDFFKYDLKDRRNDRIKSIIKHFPGLDDLNKVD